MVCNRRNDHSCRRIHAIWRRHGERNSDFRSGSDEVRVGSGDGNGTCAHDQFGVCLVQPINHPGHADFNMRGECFWNRSLQYRGELDGNRRNDHGWRGVYAIWGGGCADYGDIFTGRDEVRERNIDRDRLGKHRHVRLRELQSDVDSAFANFRVHRECFRNRKL
jgi:hypothetical protein